MINNVETDRALVWSDFKGSPNNNVGYKAMTYYDINIDYNNIHYAGDTVRFNYTLVVSFNPKKSWVKKGFENDELLRHEQVHFDIGKICAKEIAERMDKEVFLKRDYRYKTNLIFQEVMNKYADVQRRYDTETNHSIVKPEQEKWNEQVGKGTITM